MHIAILTFQGFNELDSIVAHGILSRHKPPDWKVTLCCPEPEVTSMNGITVKAQSRFDQLATADAVLIGSGIQTRDIVATPSLMSALRLDPQRQLIAAQCSGALILAHLGHLKDIPAFTDLITRPWVEETGVNVLEQAFFARGNIATAGGCLASPYLAAWLLTRLAGAAAARSALHYVAPVGEKDNYVEHAMATITEYLS